MKHSHYSWRNGVFESIHVTSGGRCPRPHRRWPYIALALFYLFAAGGLLTVIIIQSIKAFA